MKYIKHILLMITILSAQPSWCMSIQHTEIISHDNIREMVNYMDLCTINRIFTTCTTYNHLFTINLNKQEPEKSLNHFLQKNPHHLKKLTNKQYHLAIGHYVKTNNLTMLKLLLKNEIIEKRLCRKAFIEFFDYSEIDLENTIKAYKGLPKGKKYTPINYFCDAADANQCDILRVLLAYGDVNINDSNGHGTALHFAIHKKHINAAILLIKYNADVNSIGIYEQTPLHIAATNQSYDLVNLLVLNGANPHLRNSFGITAQDIIEQNMLLMHKQQRAQTKKKQCIIL